MRWILTLEGAIKVKYLTKKKKTPRTRDRSGSEVKAARVFTAAYCRAVVNIGLLLVSETGEL